MDARLADYATHSRFSNPGRHAALLRGLPAETLALCQTVQGLLIHLYELPLYGVQKPSGEHHNGDIEHAEILLDMILACANAPLSVVRPPHQRLGVICRQYALLACSILREHGIPARTRAGCANYLAAGRWVAHSVCEVWLSRWIRFDPQIDAVQREAHNIRFSTLDVPQANWLSGAEAWRSCRAGNLAADTVQGGLAALRSGVVLDLLEMCKLETHAHCPPIMMTPSLSPTPQEALHIDAIAATTLSAQETFRDIWSLYESEPSVQIEPDACS